MISPRFLDEIRNRLTLSDIIGRRTKVTRAGREFKACCPFHHEKTPSFTINDDKQFYHCFGCGAHGDVVGFVMRHDNVSFMDAVEMLSAEAGLQMPKPDPAAAKKAEKARDLHDLLEQTTQWFQKNLHAPENRNVLDYLLDRGLSQETINLFRVGFAPEDRQALRAYLKQQGFEDKQMIEAGVLRPPGKDGQPYAFFRGRVMFPVSDKRGRVVAYGGRVLPDHLRPPDRGDYTPAKYMNSSDTPLFDKGTTLYAMSLARQNIAQDQPLIVTEGYMDVIACHQAGFKGAVAPMGTALTENQILELWKMTPDDIKVPVLCFDGDDAGRRAASRACERVLPLLKPGCSIKFAFLPDGEDPDTLIKKQGSQAFAKTLDAALSLFDFLWSTQIKPRHMEDPELRAGAIKGLEEQIRQIADADIQNHYKALLRERVSETFFRRSGGRGSNNVRPPRVSGVKIKRPSAAVEQRQAMILLASVINHPVLFELYEEEIARYPVSIERFGALRGQIIQTLSGDPTLDRNALRHHLSDAGYAQELSDILSESVYVDAFFASPSCDEEHVQENFGAWLVEMEKRNWKDINAGWKQVVRTADIEKEEKIKEMMREKLSDT